MKLRPFRYELFFLNLKLNIRTFKDHIQSVRIAEQNSEDYRRNFEREKDKMDQIRNELDELRSER